MDFRKDINGLRAIAVIAVVLFHFNEKILPGGFVGVDIFFVISGFLMTSIIFKGLVSNNFSILQFYASRAKRIIPALSVLCISLLIYGWFSLVTQDYFDLAKHAASSISFISNIVYWKEASYFSTTSHEKWLLHTWSLSAEWQFYIVYPLILLLLKKTIRENKIRYIILTFTIIGYVLCIYASYKSPVGAFFLLPTRSWEMMMGGLAFLFPLSAKESTKKYIEWTGLILIAISCIVFSSKNMWPGYLSIIPVIGTFFVIASNRKTSIITHGTLSQKVGTASYSIYLWHWPIVVFIYNAGLSSRIEYILTGIASAILIGFISFKTIETRLKKSNIYVISLLIMVPLLWSGMVLYSSGANFTWRAQATSVQNKYLTKYSTNIYANDLVKNETREQCNFFDIELSVSKKSIDPACTQKSGTGGVFLWGDSHAQALSFGLRKHLNGREPFYQVASSACRPHLGGDDETKGEFKKACDQSNIFALKKIEENRPTVVIMAQHDNHEQNNFEKIIVKLKTIGVKEIIIIGPVPQWEPTLPQIIVRRHWDKEQYIDDGGFVSHLFDIDDAMQKKFNNRDDVSYISLLNELCIEKKCLAKLDANNTPLVWDYGHLSLEGSVLTVSRIIAPKLDVLLSK